eukprot:9590384-Alexandrium_andersonii.AAC.1
MHVPTVAQWLAFVMSNIAPRDKFQQLPPPIQDRPSAVASCSGSCMLEGCADDDAPQPDTPRANSEDAEEFEAAIEQELASQGEASAEH